jgi:hypothetical protein
MRETSASRASLFIRYKGKILSLILYLFYHVAAIAQIAPIHISPNQFLHKFPGAVRIEELRPWPGVLSVAEISPGLCRISITPKAVIGEKMYECLYLVELANCNGAFDVNADARRRSIPTGYERTCSTADWSPVYNRLAN